MIESGTNYRLKYSPDGGTTFKVFYGATTGQSDSPTTFRETIHKDLPGNHTSRDPDGEDTSYSVTFFLDQSEGTIYDLEDLKSAGTIVPIEEGSLTPGSRVNTQPCYISNIGKSYAVRSNGVVNVSLVATGPKTFIVLPPAS